MTSFLIHRRKCDLHSVSADERPRLEALVIEEMEHAWQAAVPLLADCGTGANWLEAH